MVLSLQEKLVKKPFGKIFRVINNLWGTHLTLHSSKLKGRFAPFEMKTILTPAHTMSGLANH